MSCKKYVLCAAAWAMALLCCLNYAAAEAAQKAVAVIASDGAEIYGDVSIARKSGYSRVAETIVKRSLRKSGFKVVDAALSAKLKNEAVLALAGGEPKKILAAVKRYKVDYLVSVSLSDADTVVNDFGTYTSSVAVTAQAVSNQSGEYLFDDLISGKAVGGTREEAIRGAIEQASSYLCELLAASLPR